MSIFPISSDPSVRRRLLREPAARPFPLALLLLALLVPASRLGAQETITQDEALRLAFPQATSIERRTAFLDERQLASVRQLAGAGVEVRQGVVTYYVGMRGGQPLGVAYFDAHRVRTMPEVLMIVVTPAGTVDRIEVLQFREPPEYRAPAGWLAQFRSRPLGRELALRGGIANITGATLTARAVTDAARRTLALHRVIGPLEPARTGAAR